MTNSKQCLRDAIELANGGPGDRHPDAGKAEQEAQRATEVLLARGVAQAELDKIVANAKKKAVLDSILGRTLKLREVEARKIAEIVLDAADEIEC
jgi:hypothetical protein